MDTLDLDQKINELTDKIRREYPTHYKQLLENPLTLPSEDDASFQEQLLSYHESLCELYENASNNPIE